MKIGAPLYRHYERDAEDTGQEIGYRNEISGRKIAGHDIIGKCS